MVAIRASGIEARFDPGTGMHRFEASGIDPFHAVPWMDEAMPGGTPPHLGRMQGDFLCAPFGVEGEAPLHGWPANAPWEVVRAEEASLTARLTRRVRGASVTKRLEVRDGEPFLYATHVFEGGEGPIPVANHACLSVPEGARIAASPRTWRTPDAAPEPDPARGRSALSYPATGPMDAFPGAQGPVALTRYPWGPAHEDFAVGVEEPGFGWCAVARPGDLYLSLRDAGALPMTMLWHSNGGRDYAPWNGRHRACLGVEEGAAGHMIGEDVALALGGRVEVLHVTGALPWSGGAVASVIHRDGMVRVTSEDGTEARLPIRPGLLPESAP